MNISVRRSTWGPTPHSLHASGSYWLLREYVLGSDAAWVSQNVSPDYWFVASLSVRPAIAASRLHPPPPCLHTNPRSDCPFIVWNMAYEALVTPLGNDTRSNGGPRCDFCTRQGQWRWHEYVPQSSRCRLTVAIEDECSGLPVHGHGCNGCRHYVERSSHPCQNTS